MDEHQSFGAVLKRLRLAAGLTHEALAERASLGARTISDLERGVSRAPRSGTLALLVQALGLSPQQQGELERAARRSSAWPGSTEASRRHPGGVPVQLTRFVGRQQEAHEIADLLRRSDVRLVTLTGSGGVGKTRLALHVAARLSEAAPDGVTVVALASVVDNDGVIQAIGRALNGDEQGQTLESITASFSGRQALLVLDNCEHLPDLALLVAELLRAEPELSVLATSRAAMRVSGEHIYPVAPLPVPDLRQRASAVMLADIASVELFVDRARQVRPDFMLTPENASAVAAICARLDGLPLAVELAAARVRALPPRVLLEQLSDVNVGGPLRLLTGGARDLPVRHQTLRDTITWSYDLLGPEAQALFRRLAVFVGGCTLDAAGSICLTPPGHPHDVLEELSSLIDNSLLVPEEGPDGEPRFIMLETIRAYALERLVASGEHAELKMKHATYYLAIVKSTKGLLFAKAGTRNRGAAEAGNVQAALQWLLQQD